MGPDKEEPNGLDELRKRAEARLRDQTDVTPKTSPEEASKLVHELRTHQIELEMQNEELRRTQQELLESRDRYSDLYDFAPVGYMTVDRKGLVLEANLTAAEMLGLERSLLVKQPLSAFVVDQDQDTYYRHRKEILDEPNRHHTCELRMRRKDNTELWVMLESRVAVDRDGNTRQLNLSLSEITERKQAEETRRRLEREVQQRRRIESLVLMAGSIAHDFNNLLCVVLGNLEFARDELPANSPAHALLHASEEAAQHCAELTGKLLVYSGRKVLRSEPPLFIGACPRSRPCAQCFFDRRH